jgi:hypothetical protein
MGLDIEVFRNVRLLTPEESTEEVEIVEVENNKSAGNHAGNIIKGTYAYSDSWCFRAGSYGTYNNFRSLLEMWEDNDNSFAELIHFSDCEGVIGTEYSKKLYRDFQKNIDSFYGYTDDERFICIYDNFMHAFEIASQDGFIEFC